MVLNNDEIAGFNLAVNIYTKLLFEQKELITGIIEVSYNQGIQDGIAYAQQLIIAQQQATEQQVEPEMPEEPRRAQMPGMGITGADEFEEKDVRKLSDQEMSNIRKSQASPAEALIAKMKGVKK